MAFKWLILIVTIILPVCGLQEISFELLIEAVKLNSQSFQWDMIIAHSAKVKILI